MIRATLLRLLLKDIVSIKDIERFADSRELHSDLFTVAYCFRRKKWSVISHFAGPVDERLYKTKRAALKHFELMSDSFKLKKRK